MLVEIFLRLNSPPLLSYWGHYFNTLIFLSDLNFPKLIGDGVRCWCGGVDGRVGGGESNVVASLDDLGGDDGIHSFPII